MEELSNTWKGCGTLSELAEEEAIVEIPLPTNYIPGMSPFAELNVANTGIISALREAQGARAQADAAAMQLGRKLTQE